MYYLVFFYSSGDHRDLHSFPTRRSSDLSVLLMGQQDTLDRFKTLAAEQLPMKVSLRKNSDRWPPLHTPIVWERSEEHTSELQSLRHLVCRLLLEKKK